VLARDRLGSADDPASPLAALLDEATLLAELVQAENIPLSAADFRQLDPQERLARAVEAMRQAGILPPDTGSQQLRRILQVTNTNTLAMANYAPQIYSERITLFKTESPAVQTAPPQQIDADIADHTLGWDRFSTHPITISIVPGDHLTIVHEPHVRTLAERLSSCLNSLHSSDAVIEELATSAALSTKETR